MANSRKKLAHAQAEIAERIVAQLFTNGLGEQAARLVLLNTKGQDRGGWCRGAVRDLIVRVLDEEDSDG